MKKAKRLAAGMLASIMTVSALTACGGGAADGTSGADPSGEAGEDVVQLSFLPGQTNAEVDDDAEVVKQIEERFGIDLKGWYVDSANFQENLNVRFAGGEMPDVMVIDNLALLPTYVEGGIVAELPIELIREKAPNYAKAIDEADDGTAWGTMMYNGKNNGVVKTS